MDIKYALLFVVFCVLEMVQPTPVPYRKLSKTELNEIALKCIDEIKIEKSVIKEVLATQILPKDDEKYKKYLACSYKKQGYLSPDGTKMIYHNLYQFLQEFYNISDLKRELEQCERIEEEDAGELCFKNLECVLAGLHKIEDENGIQSENDIESNNVI